MQPPPVQWADHGEKKSPQFLADSFVLALSIFTCSHPHTIVDELELNFCVRDGNRWTLKPINTNYSGIVSRKLNTALGNHVFQRSLEPAFRQPGIVNSQFSIVNFLGQALGILVSVSSTRYRASTSDLSTSSSTTCLTPFGWEILS